MKLAVNNYVGKHLFDLLVIQIIYSADKLIKYKVNTKANEVNLH